MEEETIKPYAYPYAFHNIDEEKQAIENSITLLKPILESFPNHKFQKSLLKLESSSETKRKKAARKILHYAIVNNFDFSITKRIAKIEYFYDFLPDNILENQAAKYFIDYYRLRLEQIIFFEKYYGAQLGRKIVLTLSPQESKSFYIKTHKGGSKDDIYNYYIEPKSVDPKEILVYSVLQALQLGPEVHYFWENSINFYIATSDLNEIGKFTEYRKIYKSLPDPVNLQTLDDKHLQICKELTKLDIFSRIFRLTDTLLHKANFGFVEKDGSQFLYLIGFTIKRDYSYEQRNLFKEFLAPYWTSKSSRGIEPTIKYAWQKRSADERCNIAAEFLTNFNIKEALKEGYRRASDISISIGISLEDLKNYYKGVKKNIQHFKKGLRLDD